ncbi:MAG: hypothetical protein R3229_09650 [Alphaproteobacteria bacterium]|nr:hypothetical protein [Alphaproteobacteria bacterium]
MITGVNQVEATAAQRSVAGSGAVRPEDERRHDPGDAFSTLQREGGGDRAPDRDGADGQGLNGRPELMLRDLTEPSQDLESKPPPPEPGMVMARQLAGDDKSDAALGRLLEDLDEIESQPADADVQKEAVQPVAPFINACCIDGPFYRAAAAYEWGQQTLNSSDPLRPGVVYSETF